MLDTVRQLIGFARFLPARAAHEQEDAAALRELQQRPLKLPRGLEIEWLGVAGYRITSQGQTLVIDPYFSRAPLESLLRGRPALPDGKKVARHLKAPGKVVGVLVSHAHFDHAVDAPEVARRHNCSAYGSRSLANLMRLHGLANQSVEVEPYRRYELGPFAVTFVPSAHARLLLGLGVPFDGELMCEHLEALTPSAYRCGQVWGIHIEVAGISIYHQGSANLVGDAIRHRGVDILLAGVTGRGYTHDYWKRLLPKLEPSTVVVSHFDDFFRPVDAPMGFATNVHLAGVPDEIARVSRDFQVVALPLLQPVAAA
ncbi:MAG: MBL fold metallo-hydrolase [Candidatus Dormiibacterota bacterium]